MNNSEMGWLLTVGWLLLGAYLVVLLALSVMIGAVEAVRNWYRTLGGSVALPIKEVDPT